MRHLSVYGDSIAAGYGAAPGRGFVPVLARLLAARRRQTQLYLNFGVAGMTSYQLASALVYNDAWNGGLMRCQSVAVLIGGDDIIDNVPRLLRGGPRGLKETARASAAAYHATLHEIRRGTRAPLAVGTIYNPYPGTPLAEEVISAYNELVILPAAASAGAAVAPIHAAFSGQQALLIDGFSNGIAGRPGRGGVRFPVHPNARGHAVIAETFAPLVT
ncbi:MAG: SGNH/GDSL hydrolase family protein [Firmicutes bacterium]|nr:SGNH/GDSL hydrolase family protein [Bacillota bacterium]